MLPGRKTVVELLGMPYAGKSSFVSHLAREVEEGLNGRLIVAPEFGGQDHLREETRETPEMEGVLLSTLNFASFLRGFSRLIANPGPGLLLVERGPYDVMSWQLTRLFLGMEKEKTVLSLFKMARRMSKAVEGGIFYHVSFETARRRREKIKNTPPSVTNRWVWPRLKRSYGMVIPMMKRRCKSFLFVDGEEELDQNNEKAGLFIGDLLE